MEEYKWNDDWRTELEEKNYNCYIRLCECRNTINDVIRMTKLMVKYNPTMEKSDCFERMIEWVGDWNNQFSVMDKIYSNYEEYLEKI